MRLLRAPFAWLLVASSLAGCPLLGAETAPASAPAKPPVSFAPPTSLLSQGRPGQPPATAPVVPEVSFPTIEELIGETSTAAPAGEESFYDPELGLRGRLPAGWKLRESARWKDSEIQFVFDVSDYPLARPILHYRKFAQRQAIDREQTAVWLRQEAQNRARQRVVEGRKDYQIRKGMLRTLHERPAFTWLADYSNLGERWIEFTTQIHTLDGAITISINAPARNMTVLMMQFETIVQSTTMP